MDNKQLNELRRWLWMQTFKDFFGGIALGLVYVLVLHLGAAGLALLIRLLTGEFS